MREIKVKAWHRELKRMFWFDVAWGNHYGSSSGYIGMLPMAENIHKSLGFTGRDNRIDLDPDNCEFMLYTNFKDSNNREIYFDDIYYDSCLKVHGIVNELIVARWLIEVDKMNNPLSCITIIGNKWANPKILEVK